MVDQDKIHAQCLSNDPKERIKALEQLIENFSLLPDKQQAWNDLHRFTYDEASYLRHRAISALTIAFSQVPNKQEAWNDLVELSTNKKSCARYRAADNLASAFLQVPNKHEAWSDLHRLTTDKDSYVKSKAADALVSAFSQIPNKQEAWNDLQRLITDESNYVKVSVGSALVSACHQVPDKQEARNDLPIQTTSEYINGRYTDVNFLAYTFSQVPYKRKAWKDLVKLTTNKYNFNGGIRSIAAFALVSSFPNVPNKQQGWNDLIKLANNGKEDVHFIVASALGSLFPHLPNKQQAWDDLVKDTSTRYWEVSVLGSIFPYLPDKQKAWNDLHKLLNDKNSWVASEAASALRSAFPYVLDKQKAWNDLIKLTNDSSLDVRYKAVYTLGSVFSQVPDKQHAWNDLTRLAIDKDSYIRTYVNHSLGKACIFKASQIEDEEDYKKELENAIEFFGKAAQDSRWNNPAQFCLPFYRSFYTIVFKKEKAKEEVDKYLAETKAAIEGSKSKELLFEAIENLADALKEVQNLENLDLQMMKGELNFYRKYCDQAADLMKDTDERAPYATAVLRKGLPILDRNLKELLKEIQKKARSAYRQSKGTAAEEIAYNVCREVQRWEIGSQDEMTQMIEGLIETFRLKMPHLPGYEHIFKEIEGIRNEKDLVNQYKIISMLVGLIPTFGSMPDSLVQDIKDIKEKTTSTSNEVKYLQLSVNRLAESVDELQNPEEYLDIIQQDLKEIKDYMPGMKEQIDEILSQLHSPSSTVAQKLELTLPIIPQIVTYKVEVDPPKLVADKILELKNLILHLKNK